MSKGYKMICSHDQTLLAEIHGDYKIGDIPPVDAYTIRDGYLVQKIRGQELRCPNPNHEGNSKIIFEELDARNSN